MIPYSSQRMVKVSVFFNTNRDLWLLSKSQALSQPYSAVKRRSLRLTVGQRLRLPKRKAPALTVGQVGK